MWQPSRSHHSTITSDALVDGIHFDRSFADAQSIGYRALAANLSDIAAMGARPVLATVALGLTADFDPQWVLACYRGMTELALATRTAIVGGDITAAPALFFSITLVGEVSPAHTALRSGARPGDVIAVSGPLGASHAGLRALRTSTPASEHTARAVAAFRTPVPRLAEGRFLARSAGLHAMMDLSDGLSSDLGRMSAASGCAALIEDVPIDPAAAALAPQFGDDPLAYALHGGEDYELLVALAPRSFDHLARRFAGYFGRPLLRVGHFGEGNGVAMRKRSGDEAVYPAGWDHLARSPR